MGTRMLRTGPALRTAVAAGLALLLVGAPWGRAAAADAEAATGSVRPVPCPIEVPTSVEVECRELTVPEDHDDPDGREVRLPFIVLHSPSPEAARDPVVYTVGGPGYSSLWTVWGFAASPVLDDRDIIVVEQRGNRHADPALTCDGLSLREEVPGHTPCLDSLRADGIDLAQYTTGPIVRDLVALRHALGLEQWNLHGGSFSSSLMLLLLDADPAGTRAAILESVKAPQETTFAHGADHPLRAIDRLVDTCTADEACAASFPDLGPDLDALVRRLNEAPVEVAVADDVTVVVDGDAFLDQVVIDALYGPVRPVHPASYLPLVVDEATGGNMGPLELAVRDRWDRTGGDQRWAWAMLLAVNCQQDAPAAGSARPAADVAASERLDGFDRNVGQLAVCEAWDLPPQPPAATAPVESDVPALVLAGSFDPVTPPAWSREAAAHLSTSTYVEFTGYGHDVDVDNPCAASLRAAFLRDPIGPLDTSCVVTTPGPAFVLPGDVFVAPGILRSAEEVSLGGPGGVPWVELVAGATVYGALLTTAALVVWGLVRVVRRRRGARTTERRVQVTWALAVVAGVGTVAVVLLLDAVNASLDALRGAARALGPSRDLVSATSLAWTAPLVGLVAIALLVAVVDDWRRRSGSVGFRLLATASSCCALGLVLLASRWGLFTMLV